MAGSSVETSAQSMDASVFVLLYQHLRQYLYFCTSSCSVETSAQSMDASVFVLLYQHLRQYLYFVPAAASVFVLLY
jgi:hypothetical protein